MKTDAVVLLTILAVVIGLPDRLVRATPLPDTIPPTITRTGSLNGERVDVCFSEPMDPISATQTTNYAVFGHVVIPVAQATLRPYGQSLQLELAQPLKYGYTVYFTVWATNLQDLAGNLITNPWYRSESGLGVGSGQVDYYYEANVARPGTNPLELGKVFTGCVGFEVTAGGSGLMTNVDGFHYLFDSYTGDFDLRLPVLRLDPVNRWSMGVASASVRERSAGSA
jgi:hypothetical protein